MVTGLLYFLMKGVFSDFFVLHEDPQTLMIPVTPPPTCQVNGGGVRFALGCDQYDQYDSTVCSDASSEYQYQQSDTGSLYRQYSNSDYLQHIGSINNEMTDMVDKWTTLKNIFKFQPLWKIRNYFGEMIAFYFAWTGMLVTSLWIPTFLGVVVFLYGLGLRYRYVPDHVEFNIRVTIHYM